MAFSHITLLLDFCVLPVTDEVLLVEDGSVGAEEGVGEEATVHVPQGAHVESLQEPKSYKKTKLYKFTAQGYEKTLGLPFGQKVNLELRRALH